MSLIIPIILICLLYLPVFLYLKDLRPHTGVIKINRPYLSPTINIYRDEYDIPHIEGETLKDCFYGLGYVHGQDRLFSMTMKKLIFSGRLSEFLGHEFLELDKYFRNLMISYSSRENLLNLDETDKEYLSSYIDGLNDFVKELWFLPNEFYILGLKFEAFRIEDSLTFLKFLSYALTFDWQHEILREKISEVFSEDLAEEMTAAFSRYHFDDTVILNDEELKQSGLYSEFIPKNRTSHHSHNFSHHHKHKYVENVFYDILDSIDNMARGSNNWVIHGNHTKSGRPIMANDPHLDNQIPSLWYLVEMIYEKGEKYVIGASLPSLPFVLAGRTQFLSWGVTALHADASDLYKETLNEDGTKYLYEGQYYDLEVINEEIKIKGEASEWVELKKTRHGPLLKKINDVYNVEYDIPNTNLSFAWVGYLKNDTTYKSLLGLYSLTSNTSEVARIFGGFVSPFMNVVYATINGDIGYYASGWLPIRSNPEESFFLNGDLKENDWIGFVNGPTSPQIVNPKKGYILSANNKLATDNIIYHTSIHMLPSSRALRIDQMIKGYIEKGIKIGVEEIKKMQLDLKDPYAEIILPKMVDLVRGYYKVIGLTPEEEETIRILGDILDKWDFKVRKESVATCIYNVWEFLFLQKLLGKIKDLEDRERIIFSLNFEQFILRRITLWHSSNASLSEEWCEGLNKPIHNIESHLCIVHLIESLLETDIYLQKKVGNNREKWKWEAIHQMKYKHIPFSETVLRVLYERKYPSDGSRRTVNVAIPNLRTEKFDGVHSANLRIIADMNEQEKSFYMIDTGLSENLFSKNYGEWVQKHRKGEYMEMKYGAKRIKEYEKLLILKNGNDKK